MKPKVANLFLIVITVFSLLFSDLGVTPARADGCYALSFDGTNDYVAATPADLPTGNSNYTIEAWIRPNAMGNYGIVGWGNWGTMNQVNALRLENSGGNVGVLNYWWQNDLLATTTDISGAWHHVAVTFNGTNRIIYLDGVLAGQDTPGSAHNVPATNFRIGSTNNGEYFNGQIDEVRIWNVSRTAGQISGAMNSSLLGNEAGLIALYRFGEGSGTSTADDTSSPSNGTLTNGPVWVSSGASTPCDPTAPTVTNVSSGTANGTYGTGSAIDVTITFSEAVTVTGTPQLTLDTGTTDQVINYASGSGTDTLTFSYTVQAGDVSSDLDYAGTAALSLNGGTIRDAATNNATLTLPAPGAAGSLGANKNIVIDTTMPTISNVSSGIADGTYGEGSTIDVTITFSEAVTVTGTPQLTLDTGTTDQVINYASGSGSDTLTFSYTVQAGDVSSDLDYAGTAALSLNGGTIRDAINNAILTLPAPGAAGSLGANKNIVIDATALTVSISSTASNPTGISPIPITITFNRSVTGFIAGEITVGNGTASNFGGSGTTYTVDVTPAAIGVVTVDVPANVAQDAGGNNNIAAGQFSITYDSVNPTVASMDLVANYPASGPSSFTVTFNKAVSDPALDTDSDDVTNPANYRLINKGNNKNADTLSCNSAIIPDDTQIVPTGVSYNAATFTSTVSLPGTLPVGYYRLYVCGSTSIVDLAGNSLNGGNDFSFDFRVLPKPATLPSTGFAQGYVSILPEQPADKLYTNTDLLLEIPSLNQKITIVGVPQSEKSWDVSWLGNNAGWLNGSAFPTWKGNSVITAHVWDALNRPGPFANLKSLKYGDKFYLHVYGQTYVYEVRESTLVSTRNVSAVMKHEDLSWVTLVTCETYRSDSDDYANRRVVRAVLVDIK